jgi:hypothetical protein
MIHGIDSGYLPFAGRKIFQDHLSYLASKKAQVWIAPLGTIGRYQQQREKAKLIIASQTTAAVTLTLTCTLDPAIFNVPLTVVIPTATTAKNVTVHSDGKSLILPTTIRDQAILCDIVPGTPPVTVSWE